MPEDAPIITPDQINEVVISELEENVWVLFYSGVFEKRIFTTSITLFASDLEEAVSETFELLGAKDDEERKQIRTNLTVLRKEEFNGDQVDT